ncbi:DoxX family protein [Robertmurraya korlensis]|uniref:DoxX family protein n=1 Tax=Robertmurraya korlensis TaxID=519977 RepID=UPI00203EB790|nr:DoxX family protein [Robertmurraya korlensis]MCM3603704.1 DoxX family protein [Robertmurraya korlensis]
MDFVFLIGRVLYALIFILAGIGHLKDFNHTVEMTKKFRAPFPRLSAATMSIIAVLGGISVAFGFYAKIGALLLFIFLIPTTFFVHRFWGIADKQQRSMQLVHFNKNLSLLGVTLMLMYLGSGPFSLE